MCKLSEVRKIAKNRLALVGIEEIEADYILCRAFNLSVTEIAFNDFELTKKQYKKVISYIKQRCGHKPITKIFGKAYFYGLEFYVNNQVLSPRSDTEILVENSLRYIKPNDRVLDLCTGSGCIAISVAKNADAYVEGCDISKKALKVAKKNAKLNKVKVDFYHSNLFGKVQGKFNVIITNPPYIETSTIKSLDLEVQNYDPLVALDGGNDGLGFYREIANKLKDYLLPDGVLLMEIGYNQDKSVTNIFKPIASSIEVVKDYNNNDRVVVVRL